MIPFIHVLTATDETSEVWAVLKLFLHLSGKKEEENSSLLDLSASPQVKMCPSRLRFLHAVCFKWDTLSGTISKIPENIWDS